MEITKELLFNVWLWGVGIHAIFNFINIGVGGIVNAIVKMEESMPSIAALAWGILFGVPFTLLMAALFSAFWPISTPYAIMHTLLGAE